MVDIQNKTLSTLFEELRFAPKRKKQDLLKQARDLLAIIKEDKEYPLEFVCFRLTGYRPKENVDGVFVAGSDLLQGLNSYIVNLSGELYLHVDQQDQKVYSVDELAKKFNVSTKTIQRWRKKGLIGQRFVFGDDKQRIGFLESSVNTFVQEHSRLVDSAGQFTKLTPKEKHAIVDRARKLATKPGMTRSKVNVQIAREMNRAIETIRYTLIDYEKRNPNDKLFKRPSGIINSKEAARIYRLNKQGVSIKQLCERYDRSRSSIHRIINQQKAKQQMSRDIEYIDSSEFIEETAKEVILPPGWRNSLRAIKNQKPLLTRQQEQELFRCYNYLKYLACLERAKIDHTNPHGSRLKQIDQLLSQAEEVKEVIIEANMRLVVSIAGKHLQTGANMPDLISEGNMSLMRAVEKFDYTRGYRFSTYATWAIAKDFARHIPAEAARPDRAASADFSTIQRDMRIPDITDIEAVEQAHYDLDQVIENNLTEREQFIIRNHFGLTGSKVTKKGKTLKEIGQSLNLSKERVRQIELIALQKLRHSLSPEEFDLLTG